MADVDTSQGGGGKGKKGGSKTKKKSTRIDMTAMVDVAFLLLTFFVLTATMTNNNVMELTMPPKTEEDNPDKYKQIDEKKIMTILLYEEDTIRYFTGITDPDVSMTDYSDEGIRKVINGHLNYNLVLGIERCKGRQSKGCWDPIFLIKPRSQAEYENLIDLLDEFAITGAPKYAIDKFSDADSIVVAAAAERALEEGEGEGDE